MDIARNLEEIRKHLPDHTRLVAVSKFHSVSTIQEAYEAGQRIFGESRVQEITAKYDVLPQDIIWHFIGHLQTNKIKYIVPFVRMIESVDSLHLLQEIDQYAGRLDRVIDVLLQVHIASEETKFGFTFDECRDALLSDEVKNMTNVRIRGLMGMATLTEDQSQIRSEFAGLSRFFNEMKMACLDRHLDLTELSMGMSDDYLIAIEEGSTLVRIGSKIFGKRE